MAQETQKEDSPPSEDKENHADYDDLQEMKASPLRRFRWVEGLICVNSDNEKMVQSLTNTQQRVAKSVLDCISLLRNPRLRLSLEDEAEGDLARLVQRVNSLSGDKERLSNQKEANL